MRPKFTEDDFVRTVGLLLVIVVGASFVQTAREFAMWREQKAFDEKDVQPRRFQFAGHEVTVRDDRGLKPGYSEEARDGVIQPMIDGASLGPASRAEVRDHRDDLGRYHNWYDAWIFRDKATGDSALYLARRLQPNPHDSPRFELTTVDSRGNVARRVFRGVQLSGDFRRYRSSQFIQDQWTAFPLSFGELLGMPPLLLVYPTAPGILGMVLLLRRPNRKRPRRPAALDQATA